MYVVVRGWSLGGASPTHTVIPPAHSFPPMSRVRPRRGTSARSRSTDAESRYTTKYRGARTAIPQLFRQQFGSSSAAAPQLLCITSAAALQLFFITSAVVPQHLRSSGTPPQGVFFLPSPVEKEKPTTARGRHGQFSAPIGIGGCKARGPRVVGRPAVPPSVASEQPQTAEEEEAAVVLLSTKTRAQTRFDFATHAH